MIGHREMSIGDYIAVLRRRFWWILFPVVIFPIVGYCVAMVIPPKYISQTLVMVEQPKIPDKYFTPIVTEQLTTRLGTMQQEILSRSRLQPIIERFGLYKDEAGNSMEDLVSKMRTNIQVNIVKSASAKQGDVPGFTIAFTSDSARTAQQVCQEITSMFISQNLSDREKRAQGTTEFLNKEVEDAKRVLDERDKAVAEFKQRFLGTLPGQDQGNLQMLNNLNLQMDALNSTLNRAQQDKTYSQSMLEQAIAEWKAGQSGTNPQTSQQILANMQSQLVTLQGRYTDDHPDVVKMKADIRQLQKKMAETEKEASEKPAQPVIAQSIEPPNVKALRTQIYQLDQTIKDSVKKQEQIQESIKTYRNRVEISPMVDLRYKEIMRDYQTAQERYDGLLRRRNDAQTAKNMESDQQSEQFRVLDAANLPERPTFPNPLLFCAGGLGGGLGIGFGLALLFEMRDKAIRNERDVEALLQLPTLALVPSLSVGAASNSGLLSRFRKAPEQA